MTGYFSPPEPAASKAAEPEPTECACDLGYREDKTGSYVSIDTSGCPIHGATP